MLCFDVTVWGTLSVQEISQRGHKTIVSRVHLLTALSLPDCTVSISATRAHAQAEIEPLYANNKKKGRCGVNDLSLNNRMKAHRFARQVQEVLDIQEVCRQDEVEQYLVLNLDILFIPCLPTEKYPQFSS